MTTLLDIKQEVYEYLGGRNDSVVQDMITRGVNAALILAAILFEPSEARTYGNVTALSTANNISIASLTRYLRLEHIYNSTAGSTMWPLSLHQLRSFALPTSGSTLYYALYGNTLHYRPQPAANQTLTVNFLQYPARIDQDADTIVFPMYEDFIISMATAFTFAGLEESESEQMWERVAAIMNVPFSAVARVRTILRKEMPRVDDLQRALSESPA